MSTTALTGAFRLSLLETRFGARKGHRPEWKPAASVANLGRTADLRAPDYAWEIGSSRLFGLPIAFLI